MESNATGLTPGGAHPVHPARPAPATTCQVESGLELIEADEFRPLAGQRVGLLVHPASVVRRLTHAARIMHAASEFELVALFGPQHGIRGETQDNMVEWDGFTDRDTGLVNYSLYGDTRQPTTEMLSGLDTLVIDLQDVGARYYTFTWTMLLCLEACAAAGKRVVVLDRPNPLGGEVREGAVLDMDYQSFVGLGPIPTRHGLTMGELAVYFQRQFELDVELDVVWMRGWRRRHWFDQTGLPWVMPSPNMPTLDTAVVYPGFCLLEGTQLSEGRGTTRPFEIFGAPFIDPLRLTARLAEYTLPGVVFRPLHFEPTFQKHAGRLCGGAQMHVTDRAAFRSVLTAVVVLATVRELWPADFRWLEPPYEYETSKPPIDILAGGTWLRDGVDAGNPPGVMVDAQEMELDEFAGRVRECLHYE